METAMHVTETKTLCSSLPCPKSKREDVSKEKEEELLYGNNEDGDEEDALSDDSMRLRLSDDEAETDDAKKSEREVPIMERESEAPEKGIVEEKNALQKQNQSNENCKDENHKDSIKQGEEESKVDSSNNGTSMTNKVCNDTNKSEQISSSDSKTLSSQMVNNHCKSSHFQGRPNRPNRNTLTRSTYLQSTRFYDNADTFTNKYYNTNNHYGRGKSSSSNKGHHSNFRKIHNSNVKLEDQCNTKDFPRIRTRRGSDPGIPTTEPICDSKTSDLEFTQRSPTVNSNFENPRQLASADIEKRTDKCEDTKNSSKNNIDKAEAASNSVKNLESEISDKPDIEHNENYEIIGSELGIDRESDQVDAKCESQAAVTEETVNSKTVIDSSISTANLDNNFDENVDEGKGSSPDELTPIVYEEEPQTNPEELENCKRETESNIEKIANSVKLEKTDENTSNETSSDNVESQFVAKTAVGIDKDDCDDATIIKEEECTKSCEIGIEIIDTIESIEIKVYENKDNSENPVESSDTSKSETTTDSDTESEETTSTSSLNSGKQSDDVESQKNELTIVDANDDKEIKNDVIPAEDEKVSNEVPKAEKEKSDVPQDKKIKFSPENIDEKNVSLIPLPSLKRASTESLDEMELSKRMRIQRQKMNESSEQSVNENDDAITGTKRKDDIVMAKPITDLTPDSKNTTLEISVEKGTSKNKSIIPAIEQQTSVNSESVNGAGPTKKNDDCEVIEVPMKQKKKRSRRSLNSARDNIVSQDDTQEKENVRQKRRTAQNAEEIIRKEFRNNCSDSESSDNAEKYVAVNYKSNNNMRPASPPTLKRNFMEDDDKISNSLQKKQKMENENNGVNQKKMEPITRDSIQTLRHIRRFFRRDENGKLAKIKQEELEELLLQKITETIAQRDEIGKLREKAKTEERKLEVMRLKCHQLEKQVKDIDMVLNRYTADRRANPEKTVTPIKINRSVGLQVNFVTEQGIQNLRQIQQYHQKSAGPAVNGTSPAQHREDNSTVSSVLKRTIKVRSPRRPECPPPAPVLPPTIAPVQNQPTITPISPAALVVGKSATDTRTSVTATVQPATVQQIIASNHQAIVMNGTIANQPIRQSTTVHVSKSKSNDLIDLTQEEEKTKTTTSMIPQSAILTPSVADTISSLPKIQPRYHTVIQAIPGSMAITGQPSIRVVQPSSQPTPTALVNNMNAPRLTYVMQGNLGPPRQLVITSTPTPIRPAVTHNRNSFPMTGLTTLSNGTVRVIPTAAPTALSTIQHPAALPESLNSSSNPSWKLPPPSPSLKISKVSNGIVLSWNMALSDKYAEIARYQLYAYQEVNGIPPSSTLWKKVGDVRALPLPMACTLTQFSEGNNYYFAVRAVDKHSRLGQYSQPGNISL